jgi:4,5-DOPA dioxygenase extradiol
MPVLFVGHGSPMNALEDNEWIRAWQAVGASLPKPRAILSISAHWLTEGTRVHVAPHPYVVCKKAPHDHRGALPVSLHICWP